MEVMSCSSTMSLLKLPKTFNRKISGTESSSLPWLCSLVNNCLLLRQKF